MEELILSGKLTFCSEFKTFQSSAKLSVFLLPKSMLSVSNTKDECDQLPTHLEQVDS